MIFRVKVRVKCFATICVRTLTTRNKSKLWTEECWPLLNRQDSVISLVLSRSWLAFRAWLANAHYTVKTAELNRERSHRTVLSSAPVLGPSLTSFLSRNKILPWRLSPILTHWTRLWESIIMFIPVVSDVFPHLSSSYWKMNFQKAVIHHKNVRWTYIKSFVKFNFLGIFEKSESLTPYLI